MMQLDFAADRNGADAVCDGGGILLVVECGKVEVEAKTGERCVGDEGVKSLLVAGNALGIGIVTGFDLDDPTALDGGTVGDSGPGWIEGKVLGVGGRLKDCDG